MSNPEDVLVVITNLPDEAAAQSLAESLIGSGLAACVNILAPCRSVYRWQGALESAQEIPLLIKTTRTGYAALQAAILAQHPYDLPEIIALPVVLGLPAYLNWVDAETKKNGIIPC